MLLVGANPGRDAAILNARIRKRWRMGNLRIGLIGERTDLTYPYEYLGAGGQTLAALAAGEGGIAFNPNAAEKAPPAPWPGPLSPRGGGAPSSAPREDVP